MKMKIIVILLLFLATAFQVSALGIMPSSKTFNAYESQSYTLNVFNDDNREFDVLIDVSGDLADFINVNKKIIHFTKDKSIEQVLININVPENLNISQGVHENSVTIKQVPVGEGTIEATVSLISKIKAFVPYDSKTLELSFFNTNFKNLEKNNFVVEIRNLGIEDVNDAILTVEIYSEDKKIETLPTKKISLTADSKKIIDIPWTPKLKNGKYVAKASINYDGKSASAKNLFSVGEPEIIITNLIMSDFSNEGVAVLDMSLSNNWTEPIQKVFGEVKLFRGSDQIYDSTTVSVDIDSEGNQSIRHFIDTKTMTLGNYTFEITLNYLGISRTYSFPTVLEENGFVFPDFQKESKTNLWIFVVIILALIIVYFIIKRIRNVFKKRN